MVEIGLMIFKGTPIRKKKCHLRKKVASESQGSEFFIYLSNLKKISQTFAHLPSFPPDLPSSLSSLPSLVPSSWELASLSLPFAGRFGVNSQNSQFTQKLQLAKIAGFFLETHGAMLSLSVNDSRKSHHLKR